MKSIYLLIGVLTFIAAILGGLYVAFYVCLYGGILQIIAAATAKPIIASGVAFGIVRVLCTGLAGWITFFVGAAISGTFFEASKPSRRRSW